MTFEVLSLNLFCGMFCFASYPDYFFLLDRFNGLLLLVTCIKYFLIVRRISPLSDTHFLFLFLYLFLFLFLSLFIFLFIFLLLFLFLISFITIYLLVYLLSAFCSNVSCSICKSVFLSPYKSSTKHITISKVLKLK